MSFKYNGNYCLLTDTCVFELPPDWHGETNADDLDLWELEELYCRDLEEQMDYILDGYEDVRSFDDGPFTQF